MVAAQLFQAMIFASTPPCYQHRSWCLRWYGAVGDWISRGCVCVCPTRSEGKCFGGFYRSFRFVFALIQFGLEPLGAKLAKSPQKPSNE